MSEQLRRDQVARHYGDDDLTERLLGALVAAGLDLDALTPADLRPIDQFHIGGQPSVQELSRLAQIGSETNVLDVGGGLGGPARTLANDVGCHVTVLDLTESFVRAGAELTARSGLSDLVTHVHGDALALPFPDGTFDLAWLQHASMNIPDKRALFTELRRVLRPGGTLALHEVTAGRVQPVHFPVPWARDSSISFLTSPDELRDLLGELGFREIAWNDVTEPSEAWFRATMERAASGPPNALGLRLLIGDRFLEMGRNLLRNMEEGRIAVIQAVLKSPE
jgi:SAM-dependent methyltransferase